VEAAVRHVDLSELQEIENNLYRGLKQSGLSKKPVCNATFERVYAQEVGNRVHGNFHYMDFTGSSVFLNRQILGTAEIYSSGVFGNPHSKSESSRLSTKYVSEMRSKIYEYFSADPEEYEVVFTRSATGALVLLGGAFPFSSSSGSSYAYTVSNHNSVLGIRSYAQEKGARVGAVTEEEIEDWLSTPLSQSSKFAGTVFEGGSGEGPNGTSYSLFAYPAKDNYEGVLYPLRWVEEVQRKSTPGHEWLVLLDTAAYAPTYRLNLSSVHPDFVVVSFYKVFGLPTGVGAWIMKRSSEQKLRRVYWGGSSVFTATSALPWEVRFTDAAKWEDGTLPFLEIASLETGFQTMEYLGGIDRVQEYVTCLGSYMSQRLQSLTHSNGQPLLRLYGKHYDDPSRQSGIANFQLLKPSGELFGYRTASLVLSGAGFQVRDGCMCNPGACYRAVGVTDEEVRAKAMAADGNYAGWEWIEVERDGKLVRLPLGSIRVSLGWMSRQSDIDSLVDFLMSTYRDVEVDPQPATKEARTQSKVKGTSASFYGC
jgi:molybdenum cofactor sulfurtransferase